MITLALDTSTARGSVALLCDDKPLREETFSRTVPQQHLFGAIQRVLAAEQLAARQVELFVVGVGPGSFTGIRMGIAAAKGLALPGCRPVRAARSFDALALTALPQMPRDCEMMCVLCDARREEVCYALYDRQGRRASDWRLGPLDAIELHNPVWFVSAEIERFREALRETFGGFASVCVQPVFPRAALLRAEDLPLEPIYLRRLQYKRL